jgi:2-polyprenyl-3-methyl-5-hydroxy-6-metoxy-1,4-benzoquinol methylase
MKCRICENSHGNVAYDVKEMMFGFRDVFRYFQCSKCNCLQIESIPSNIDKYYPDNYYSFQQKRNQHKIVKLLTSRRDNYAVFNKGIIGKILYNIYPRNELRSMHLLSLNEDTRILDVGSGAGNFLISLAELGFRKLSGIDPYISQDIQYENGLVIHSRSITEMDGNCEIITFHHSFEHMANPIETIKLVSDLLVPGGYCIIRIPIVSSYAWEHYKVNWIQLDAPQHTHLHSLDSMKTLAHLARLNVEQIRYDSTSLQFWGSEEYARDIPRMDARSYYRNPKESIFSKMQICDFEKRARELNKANLGDQAVFYLKKA